MAEIKKLNEKHKLACYEYMSGKNKKQAYLTAYPNTTEISAEASGPRLFTYAKIKEECMRIMERKSGLRVVDLIDKLTDLTTAEKDIVLNHELIKVADNPTRTTALQMAFDLLGLRSKNEVNIDNRSLNVSLQADDITKLSSLTKALRDIRLRKDKISGLITGGTPGGG